MMLAMSDDEAVLTGMAMVLGTMLLGGLLVAMVRSRNRRLKALEQALQSGAVDTQTKQLLVAELTKPGMLVRAIQTVWGGGKLLVALGWVGVFAGVGMLLSGAEELGTVFALMSFAILTVPFALRVHSSRSVVGWPKP
jgi:hypothetical protein